MTRLLLVLAIITSCSFAFAAGNVPEHINKSSETEARFRYLQSVNNFTLFAEAQVADQSDHREYKSIMLGSY